MSKAPKMPKIPPEDGIERHKAYTRLNPNGDKEFVVDDDEETLNELSEDILDMLESVAFGGPLPTGGGAGSAEQPQSDRRHNSFTPQLVGSSGDQAREAGEDVNNFTSSTPQAADGPELSRAKSKIGTKMIRGVGPRNKYIAAGEGDPLDGATRNESFTGTGAIAISPGGGYDFVDDEDDDEENDNQESEKQTESSMTRQNDVLSEQVNQLLAEWEPSFKGGEYSPGDYQMPSPTGGGVADRKPTKDKVGAYDTNTSNQGKEWPRKHKETAAMCDVDEDGVENKPQGGHESSVGDPKDGHQTELGHNWPDEAKNTGGGVAEPFEGDRWSDGGTLKGGSGQNEGGNIGSSQKMPTSGPITGTTGPQLGQPSESWDPQSIGTMMEGGPDLQVLFNSYARDYNRTVCVEDFQALCNAHGGDAMVDEVSLLRLMEANQEFIFYQGEDANGPYWAPTPIAENTGAAGVAAGTGSGKPWETDEEECEEDDDDCSTEGRKHRPFDRTVSELQVRPAGVEARGPIDDMAMDMDGMGMGDPDLDLLQAGPDDFAQSAGPDDLGLGGMDQAGFGPESVDELEMDDFDDMGGQPDLNDGCPECGAPDTGEENCPECGVEMGMGSEEEQYGPGPGGDASMVGSPLDVDIDDEMDFRDSRATGRSGGESGFEGSRMPGPPRGGMGSKPPQPTPFGMESKMENSPAIMDSLNKFMKSARKILESNRQATPQHIGEALRYSWAYHAGSVNPRTAPTKVRTTLEGLATRFPIFGMVMEGGGDAMGSSEGTAIGTGGASNSSKHLPDQPGPDEIDDLGEPLGKKQKNTTEGPPIVKNTHKGMDGNGSIAKAVQENVARLSRHVQKSIREGSQSLRGKYNVHFSIVVAEGKIKNRTPIRTRLAEALADAEELLQLHKSEDVELEASYADSTGAVVLKHNVPLLTIKPRGLLCSEGVALFRFQRTAERFADELVAEGYQCRVIGHNWGSGVVAKTPLAIAESAFRSLSKRR